MALGAVAIGYGEPKITRGVLDTMAQGTVSGLSHVLEVEVAERFCNVVPCAERVQFLKTGAEAVSAAVRVARAYTGRSVVVGSGYFGWHDWCSSQAGVPEGGMQRDYRAVPFGDVAALDAAVQAAGNQLAAIIIEPVVERLASPEWIARARELCDTNGAALIFDEMENRIPPGDRRISGNVRSHAGSCRIRQSAREWGSARCRVRPCRSHGLPQTHVGVIDTGERGFGARCRNWRARLARGRGRLWRTRPRRRRSCVELVAVALKASGLAGVSQHGIDPMLAREISNRRRPSSDSCPSRPNMARCSSAARTTLRRSPTMRTRWWRSKPRRATRSSRCAVKRKMRDRPAD